MTDPVTPARRTTAAASSEPERLRTLLVDDHASVLRFLSLAFSSDGCDVTTAARAEEALELVTGPPFDLVVSDIKMPGLSGLDLLRAVKEQQPATPVVLITGAPSVESAVFGLRHQAYDYLVKPFSAEQIKELLQRIRTDRQRLKTEREEPAGLTQELARRQLGMEMLSKIGSLAFQGLDSAMFVDKALAQVVEILDGDAAAILLFDDDQHVTPTQRGEPGLVAQLVTLGQQWFTELQRSSEPEGTGVQTTTEPFVALGTLIPGDRKAAGILCLARKEGSEVLPDEREFLVAYARTVGVALQQIVLGENLEENLIDTIAAFVNALESKDPYLKGHSARVSLYAGEIARALGLGAAQAGLVRRAGILHDLGKLVVMDSILQKPARLTPEEANVMQGHPVNAAKILKPLRFLAQEAEAIKRHHERYDGNGYPDGLKGDQIPLPARIVTVADSFDAMTSNRPYRSAMPLENALREILKHAGAQFDPAVTEAFAKVPLARLNEISRFYDNSPEPFPIPAAKPESDLVAAWSRLTRLAPGSDFGARLGRQTQAPSPA
jgi:putative nucleotidyltransferase with HDIG domain